MESGWAAQWCQYYLSTCVLDSLSLWVLKEANVTELPIWFSNFLTVINSVTQLLLDIVLKRTIQQCLSSNWNFLKLVLKWSTNLIHTKHIFNTVRRRISHTNIQLRDALRNKKMGLWGENSQKRTRFDLCLKFYCGKLVFGNLVVGIFHKILCFSANGISSHRLRRSEECIN